MSSDESLPIIDVPDWYSIDVDGKTAIDLTSGQGDYLLKLSKIHRDNPLAIDLGTQALEFFAGHEVVTPETSTSSAYYYGALVAIQGFCNSDTIPILQTIVFEQTQILGIPSVRNDLGRGINYSQASVLAKIGMDKHKEAEQLNSVIGNYFRTQEALAVRAGDAVAKGIGEIAEVGFGLVLHKLDCVWSPSVDDYWDRVIASEADGVIPSTPREWDTAMTELEEWMQDSNPDSDQP